jgi:hypothetical protein
VAFAYVKDYLTGSRLLGGMVAEVLSSAITLTNGLTIECFPCTLRSLRGWTIPVGVLDELAFFRLEGQADSNVEIQASLRRGMLSFPAPRLVKISTPTCAPACSRTTSGRGGGRTTRTCSCGRRRRRR